MNTKCCQGQESSSSVRKCGARLHREDGLELGLEHREGGHSRPGMQGDRVPLGRTHALLHGVGRSRKGPEHLERLDSGRPMGPCKEMCILSYKQQGAHRGFDKRE